MALIAELAEVIARPKFAQRLAEIVEPAHLPQPVSRDPDDDVVLAANALLIVSGDRDLLDLSSSSGIRILAAAEALTILTEKRGLKGSGSGVAGDFQRLPDHPETNYE